MLKRICRVVVLAIVFIVPLLLTCCSCFDSHGKTRCDLPQRLYPVDEGMDNPDFRTFRDELIQACRRKDLKFLLKHTDENISFSFGSPDSGIEYFIRAWGLDKSPEKSLMWQELEDVLKMGGVFEKDGSFVAPYTFAKFPGDIDGFEAVVCISSNVFLRAFPSSDSPIIKKLCYDIVAFSDAKNGKYDYWRIKGKPCWLKVKTREGEEGYVSNKYIRSPIDYRAVFVKKKGVWKMTDFISGD